MKVTVSFGEVRILVPCGSGNLLVKDLINEATRRYKKATAKEVDSLVTVYYLQTQSGILDPDDCVRDVADDREEMLASFEDSGLDPDLQQGGGDGASGNSSVGTGSPDIFCETSNAAVRLDQVKKGSIPHIEVTSTTACPLTVLGLQVRRSSDPNMLATLTSGGCNKRWSAAAPHYVVDSPERILMEKSGFLEPQWEDDDDSQSIVNSRQAQQLFTRPGRLSMQFLSDGTGYKWIEAAEKLHSNIEPNIQQSSVYPKPHSTKSLPREGKRKEPLGQAYESIREKDDGMLLVINERGTSLGLIAIPDKENGGGLLVQHVERGSRAERGHLCRGDRILEINGHKLIGMNEKKILEHLRSASQAPELRIRVKRSFTMSNGKHTDRQRADTQKANEMIEDKKLESWNASKVATVSPTRKPHGVHLQVANTRKLGRKLEITLRKGSNGLGFSVTTRDNPAGGQCPIYIKNILPRGAAIEDGRLKPGDRLLEVDDVPMTGKTQADVVSILRATKMGSIVRIIVSRQQELVEQNERQINFDEKNYGLQLVLDTSVNPIVSLENQQRDPQRSIVPNSRKDQIMKSICISHEKPENKSSDLKEFQHLSIAKEIEPTVPIDHVLANALWGTHELLTLHIPVHDTEKAGLGVSVKGKTNSNVTCTANSGESFIKNDGDLGIFVKNVIHGGAASRDGRLRMNDQLLSVNGVSLLGQNNAEAMETLRRAMVNKPGKHPGMITLSVARKIIRSISSADILEQTNNSSNTSESSSATVVYLNPKNERQIDEKNNCIEEVNRWNNPVLSRLTGASEKEQRPSLDQLVIHDNSNSVSQHGLRNESYYLATKDKWSPSLIMHNFKKEYMNNIVLIEDDPDPMAPSEISNKTDESLSTHGNTQPIHGFDTTYSSQLSLETNNSGVEHFSRDALGRRSISEKHHAALDARETGTYQRNKKMRQERERERRIELTKSALFCGSVESLSPHIDYTNVHNYKHIKSSSGIETGQFHDEAHDKIGDLGPSLGLKKSSSLESLQTMVQEIQMSDEARGPSALRAPRGRGREDSLRAAVIADPEVGKPRKHWLLEENDIDAGFVYRNGPFQSSLNDGKHKSRCKKPSLLRGIGHMFRFGKNRKDIVSSADPNQQCNEKLKDNITADLKNVQSLPSAALATNDRNTRLSPPAYQSPPPLPSTNVSGTSGNMTNSVNILNNSGIQQNDIFNHRYQHYSDYDELYQQHQISRRHQHYHSLRSSKSQNTNLSHHLIGNSASKETSNQNSAIRPTSGYYEYETVEHNVGTLHKNQQRGGSLKKNGNQQGIISNNQKNINWKLASLNGFSPPTLNSSARSRGPFVTHVTIREQNSSTITAPSRESPTYQSITKHQQIPACHYINSLRDGAQVHSSKM